MTKTIEIERAPNGLLRLKTYVNGLLTNVSGAMPPAIARMRAEQANVAEVVDHTDWKR